MLRVGDAVEEVGDSGFLASEATLAETVAQILATKEDVAKMEAAAPSLASMAAELSGAAS